MIMNTNDIDKKLGTAIDNDFLCYGDIINAMIEVSAIRDKLVRRLKKYPNKDIACRFEKKFQELLNEGTAIASRHKGVVFNDDIIKDVTCKYYDYYGKDACIPSIGLTEISWKYVRLYNTYGLLATYNRKTGEFTPKFE